MRNQKNKKKVCKREIFELIAEQTLSEVTIHITYAQKTNINQMAISSLLKRSGYGNTLGTST